MLLTRKRVYSTLDCERLHHFLTHYMRVNVGVEKENLQLTVLTPDETAHNWWKIIYGKWGLTIDNDALFTVIDKINNPSDDYEVYASLRSMISSPTDKTVQLFTALPLSSLAGDMAAFDEDTLNSFFDFIDKKFDKLYHYIEEEFGFISRVFTHAAEAFSRDINKDKVHDIYLELEVEDDPTKEVEFFFALKMIPAYSPNGREGYLPARPITEDEKETLFGYLSPKVAKADQGITLKQELDSALDRLNLKVKDFLRLADDKVGYERTYIWGKVHGILVPSIVNIHLEAFSVFGGFLGNIDDIDTEEVMKIKEEADAFITRLLTHLMKIPPANDTIDHYAIDVDSLVIYARDNLHQVVGKLDDSQYDFATLFEPFYSDGFMQFAKRHLKTIKNKHVFSKLGEIVKKSTDGDTLTDAQPAQEMETAHKPTLH